ncbi:flagellar biosynthetic protein FliQ [Carboxydothermus islandicus]|uniref:Flagellar biosynthetic protein FliQ n=1 Tax=Carboxydothermus islandicus TaxID=661089 RepID=A0A1L8D4S8_9THEO|nr:flagellar biosynthesis protein FliQ [Carboxydothermus islandicus]GAV26170.1 flagellar biosynthetic protein FliQ [Carboxydothermus islandicus]
MDSLYFIHLAQKSFTVLSLLVGPPLIVSLVIGLIVGILQAATQIQEQTLTFVPKLIAVFLTLLILSGWMLNIMVDFTGQIFQEMAKVRF